MSAEAPAGHSGSPLASRLALVAYGFSPSGAGLEQAPVLDVVRLFIMMVSLAEQGSHPVPQHV